MSDKYRTVDRYECTECGKVYNHPSLAESCWYRNKMEEVLEKATAHQKLARYDLLEMVEDAVEAGEFDDERLSS